MSFLQNVLTRLGISASGTCQKDSETVYHPRKINIAVITPSLKEDYLANTILDGLRELSEGDDKYQFYISSKYPGRIALDDKILPRREFIKFAKCADLIFLLKRKRDTDYRLAGKIGEWNKTVFIDGSELGGNKRLDASILKQLYDGEYKREGAISKDMLKLCALYFRREKPYLEGILPLPFGIDSAYTRHYDAKKKRDIDFTCIWGQEDCPPLRREVRERLELFCRENGFICRTEKTKDPDEFYEILSRTKVGISVSGGGFDTLRFWEILGNNCLLLTEKIDIYRPEDKALNYKRIFEFKDINEFEEQLKKIADFLRNGYDLLEMGDEYKELTLKHSSRSRVLYVLTEAMRKGIIAAHKVEPLKL